MLRPPPGSPDSAARADSQVKAARTSSYPGRSPAVSGIAGQALVYPALGGDTSAGSYVEMAEAPGLTTADVRYYREVYRAPDGNPYAFPLAHADLSGLPPAFITGAFFDPLRDDARQYAGRLAAAGVEVWFREEPQMIHAWLRARHMSEGAREGFRRLAEGVAVLVGTR